jgi:hypothetical protein
MQKKYLKPAIYFCLLDVLLVGLGMGIPVAPIVFGVVIGWFIPQIFNHELFDIVAIIQKSILTSIVTSLFTMVMMIIIWGPISLMLFDKNADINNFGIPLILFDPKASFIGWIILMIIISPVLQLLTTSFGAIVRIAWKRP